MEVRTLASLSDEGVVEVQKAASRPSPRGLGEDVDRQGTALVIASAVSHESDRHDQPRHLLLELGGVYIIRHVIWQVNLADVRKVVLVVGFQGEEIKKEVESMLQEDDEKVFTGLMVEFVELGRGWRGGFAASVLAAKGTLQNDHQFVLIGADHIVNEELLHEMARIDLEKDGDEGCVLVETDLEGMVGLPTNVVHVALRPLHGKDRIYDIGPHLPTYAGIEAGVVTSTTKLLEELEKLRGTPNFTLSSALRSFAQRGTLKLKKTNGATWFSVETDEASAYTEKNLKDHGQLHTLKDGRAVRLIGLPKRIKTSPTDGSEWAEFNVAKWRSAVFTTNSYFDQLYRDTTDFIAELCDNRGGKEEVLLVEVGCGTGEALVPLFDHAKYVLGIDFNSNFVDFCNSNLDNDLSSRVKFLTGDAQKLDEILQHEVLEEWRNATKVVICVGNTVGIMPQDVKDNVYKQMLKAAGTTGAFGVVYWNGNKFGDAVQHFYHKNPQLCGPFQGDSIDLDSCTLTTPSGYRTHWTTPKEARRIFEEEIGAEILKLEEKGKGVLVAGRQSE